MTLFPSIQFPISNASVFGAYKCKAVNSIGSIERLFTLRPGLKPATPSLSILLPQPPMHTGREDEEEEEDVYSVAALDGHSNAIYLNLSLPEHSPPLNVTEMDATGFRVQFISRDNYTQTNRTWTNAEFVDFVYRADGGPHVLQNLTWNRDYLLRASTKNVAGFSDFSEPLEFNLSPSKMGHSSGNSLSQATIYAGVALVSLVVGSVHSMVFMGALPRH